MTALPSRWGAHKSVGATALVSHKRATFRYPALVFHRQRLPVKKAEPPKREVLALVPRLPVPTAPLFAHPRPLALPKAGCSPPTQGHHPPGRSQRVLGKEPCPEEPRAGAGGPWSSPASSRAGAGTHAAEGEKTTSSLWLALKAHLRHRSPVRSLGS